jgi:hypothetical protein
MGARVPPLRLARRQGPVPPGPPSAFPDHDALLEGFLGVLAARAAARRLEEALERGRADQGAEPAAAWASAAAWGDWFHRSFEATPDGLELVSRARLAGLTPLERELLVGLLVVQLGVLHARIGSPGDLLEALRHPGLRMLAALRALGDDGRLVRSGLVEFEDPDEDPLERAPLVATGLVARLQEGEQDPRGADAGLSTQEALLGFLEALARAAQDKAASLQESPFGSRRAGRHRRAAYRLERLLGTALRTLAGHPDWPLARLALDPGLEDGDRLVLLLLTGRELGHLPSEDRLYLGQGLAAASAASRMRVQAELGRLGPRAPLMKAGLIQACDGPAVLLEDDPSRLAELAYELGERAREALALERKVKPPGEGLRKSRVRLSQLVLPARVREVLRLALVQARNADRLWRDWGLGGTIAYGRAVTLLFAGPPGVGKTAAAEGLAHALKRPLLVADYAQIQNMFVGGTEKNIAAAFRKARWEGAVLFWDEADAMFYDRDLARQPFEVRDVNVLLQELERFEGVCVLATNRAASLDPALERRISLKVEFASPDRPAREAIWRKLLPRKLPLAKDVDLAGLAAAELTGGEIKNAVLNAARMALARGARARVRMRDLEAAVRLELDGRLRREKGRPLGFGVS